MHPPKMLVASKVNHFHYSFDMNSELEAEGYEFQKDGEGFRSLGLNS
jgi:hypothetical protein